MTFLSHDLHTLWSRAICRYRPVSMLRGNVPVLSLPINVLDRRSSRKYGISTGFIITHSQNCYEARDLFPWQMLTKTAISCFLNVQKIWHSAQINLSSTLNFYRRYCFRRNNIHREKDQWNRRRFGAKRHVTVPCSVTPIKPIVCKWIYISQGWYCQMTYKLHYIKFPSAFS